MSRPVREYIDLRDNEDEPHTVLDLYYTDTETDSDVTEDEQRTPHSSIETKLAALSLSPMMTLNIPTPPVARTQPIPASRSSYDPYHPSTARITHTSLVGPRYQAAIPTYVDLDEEPEHKDEPPLDTSQWTRRLQGWTPQQGLCQNIDCGLPFSIAGTDDGVLCKSCAAEKRRVETQQLKRERQVRRQQELQEAEIERERENRRKAQARENRYMSRK